MNKTSSTPKRSIGRPQPKRPKLDFMTKSASPLSAVKVNEGVNISVNSRNPSNTDLEADKINITGAHDWDDDDDFSGDMLEKVCLLADLSQAMVNNEPRGKEQSVEEFEKQGQKRNVSERDVFDNGSKLVEELDKLRMENEKLTESIKVKEGEVQILRSQLKQNQEAKDAETLNNIRVMEEMRNTYKEKIEAAQKEFEVAKTELHFKEMELKSLMERCQHMEANGPKVILVEPQAAQLESKRTSNTAQITSSQSKEKFQDKGMKYMDSERKEETITFTFVDQDVHEGQKLRSFMCSEYFSSTEEPSIISLYGFNKGCGFHVSSLDFDKREKYKWSGLPKQEVFVKDTYDLVSKLFLYENFEDECAKGTIENLLNVSVQILQFQKDLLLFLEKLQEKNSELDDSDYTLLENEDKVSLLTVKHLLHGKVINKEECGVESRRILGMLVSLVKASNSSLGLIFKKTNLLLILRDIATSIGNLRKPTRYTGILAGITLLLTQIVQDMKLKRELVCILNEIIEEVIFARPKLNVLILVVEALASGSNNLQFVQALCRKGLVESCALYMDSKLHQAMFFTKDACPLKLLCTQIMGLSCIPVNREMRWYVTNAITKWLNRAMDSLYSREISWLPNNLPDNEEKCFDIMECFIYLLNMCLKDYESTFNVRDESTSGMRIDVTRFRLSIIGDACLLFRRILKLDQRLLHESPHNLRFASLLKNLNAYDGLNAYQNEAISWINELLESDLKNPVGCIKQCNLNFPGKDTMDVLKINDDLIIF